MVANTSARDQLDREEGRNPCSTMSSMPSFAPENLLSRDMFSPSRAYSRVHLFPLYLVQYVYFIVYMYACMYVIIVCMHDQHFLRSMDEPSIMCIRLLLLRGTS